MQVFVLHWYPLVACLWEKKFWLIEMEMEIEMEISQNLEKKETNEALEIQLYNWKDSINVESLQLSDCEY